jgi:hypothetical protein
MVPVWDLPKEEDMLVRSIWKPATSLLGVVGALKGSALTTGIVIALLLGSVRRAEAGFIYQTGFENPPFATGAVAGQDGWSVFGVPGVATVQNSVALTGTQAVLVDAAAAGSQQTGPWHSDPFDTTINVNKTVVVDADVLLKSSSNPTAWQFAALTPNLGTFFGGFNVLTDGRLQLITPGFPDTNPVVTRDVWNHFEVRYDFPDQTFDVLINNNPVAGQLPFLTSQTVYGTLLFDSFASGNDQGYLDNVLIQDVRTQSPTQTTPEPSTIVLLGSGGLTMLGYRLCRRRRPV